MKEIHSNEEKWVKALEEIREILNEAKVRYWLKSGTLLGAIREGKFISWDTDIDFGIPSNEAKKIIEKTPDLEKKGYKVTFSDGRICLSKENEKESPSIGICIFRFEDDIAWATFRDSTGFFNKIIGYYFYGFAESLPYFKLGGKKSIRRRIISTLIPSALSPFLRKTIFKISKLLGMKVYAWVTPKSYFENLERINFYGMEFNIPSPPEEYLALTYGEEWRKPDPNWDWRNSKNITREFFKNRDEAKYTLFE